MQQPVTTPPAGLPQIAPGTPAPTGTPAEILQGLRAQRSELQDQLESLEDRREEISSQLQEPMVRGADRQGLEARIRDVDEQMTGLEQLIATNNFEIARATAVPGAVQPPRPVQRSLVSDDVQMMAGTLTFFLLLPFVIAYARRLWRRGAVVVPPVPAEVTERLTRIEHAVDAIAVEVERVGEGQRYVTQMFSGQAPPRAVGAGAAEPLEARAREASPEIRR
ncbi:MAG TPA: hypothetical protein VLE53_18230 [Gemmatimonadaceae bacterium]|nr:hypothetical protein [Gemmatimonadaceae bacterium]